MSRPQPTKRIIEFARRQPGGVIRWSEAEGIYREESKQARRGQGFKQNVGRLLKKHFTKVGGIRGFYVLDETIVGDPSEEKGLNI